MSAPLRILFYNWVAFDDEEKRGGGVSIYQRNLIEALVARGWAVDFLSSGLAYDIETDAPRVEPTDNPHAPLCRSFQMVNSPVMSPGHSAFGQNDRLFEKGPAHAAFLDFLTREGPWDIVHFNNIEGIPFSFLDLKQALPHAAIVLSHHNYFAVCPQVNLWKREVEACTDYDRGRACTDCLVWRPPRAEILAATQLSTLLGRAGISARSPAFAKAFANEGTLSLLQDLAARQRTAFLQDDPLPTDPMAESGFARRRRLAVDLLNRSVDLHLAVSERVARVIGSYGIDASRTAVSYIGTRHGEVLARSPKRQDLAKPGSLSIAFLGYRRADKGFFFLVDALLGLPSALARNLRVKLAAKAVPDPKVEARLAALARHLGALEIIDGYAHDDLPRILRDVDLGVVPVIWEDNLPQVALEIMSHGVPVLTSDRGGAQELSAHPDFVFAAGSARSLAEALRRIQSGEVRLSAFWDGALHLRGTEDHLTELLALYDRARQALPASPPPPRTPTETLLTPEDLLTALPPSAHHSWITAHA